MKSVAQNNSQPAKNKDRWLRLTELQEVIPLKTSRIYDLVHKDQIPYYKLGQTLFFKENEIINWMEGNKVCQ